MPTEWFPEFSRPLGPPDGPAVCTGGFVWQRSFKHAKVYVDLNDINSSRIDWQTSSRLKSDDRANAPLPEATRLRVEYLDSPLTIDTPRPRFSWALPAAVPRATVQASYRLVVSTAPAVAKPAAVWDSGVVRSNRTLNVPYGGGDGAPPQPLQSDTDYSWSVTWTDAHGSSSAASRGTFSIAILGDDPASSPDWHAPAWVSSVANGSLSTYRAEFELEAAPVRARMYHVGLGYSKTWINGNLTDAHELGQYVTFQERVLYDCLDVARLLRSGKNALGVMLGAGWFAQNSTAHGPRQFLVLLSVTMPDGKTTYFRSAIAGRDTTARDLVFRSTAGPEQSDNMYKGEDFDGESGPISKTYQRAESGVASQEGWLPRSRAGRRQATWPWPLRQMMLRCPYGCRQWRRSSVRSSSVRSSTLTTRTTSSRPTEASRRSMSPSRSQAAGSLTLGKTWLDSLSCVSRTAPLARLSRCSTRRSFIPAASSTTASVSDRSTGCAICDSSPIILAVAPSRSKHTAWPSYRWAFGTYRWSATRCDADRSHHALDMADSAECAGHPDGRLADCSLRP